MAITYTVKPGKVFQATEKITPAKLNQLGQPTIQAAGTMGPADMNPADYSPALAAGPYFYGVDTGTVNQAVVTLNPALATLADGVLVAVKVANKNTGPVTLNVNGLGGMAVVKNGANPLEPGDWIPGQIVHVRYRLDPNIVPALTTYSAGGTVTLAVVAGWTYTWTKAGNDVSLTNGATVINASGNFVAVGSTVTLTGTISALITATLLAVSNVWQMLSQLGNPNLYYDFVGPSAYIDGIRGLVPRPRAGQQAYYLRADGTWVDLLTLAAGLAAPNTQYLELYKQQQFS